VGTAEAAVDAVVVAAAAGTVAADATAKFLPEIFG
jgi:hypothetical protein